MAALRAVGCSVCILSGVGKGVPDLLVGRNGYNVLLEIKDGSKPPSKQRLTPDEQAFHDTWLGIACIVSTPSMAVHAMDVFTGPPIQLTSEDEP